MFKTPGISGKKSLKHNIPLYHFYISIIHTILATPTWSVFYFTNFPLSLWLCLTNITSGWFTEFLFSFLEYPIELNFIHFSFSCNFPCLPLFSWVCKQVIVLSLVKLPYLNRLWIYLYFLFFHFFFFLVSHLDLLLVCHIILNWIQHIASEIWLRFQKTLSSSTED